jgi:hypothetical protein
MAMRTKKSLFEQSVETAKAAVPVVESVVESIVEAAKDGFETAKEIAGTTEAKFAEVAPAAVVDKLPMVDAPAHQGRGRLKKLLLLGGLAAIGALIFKKLRSDSTSDNWQSSYVPTPPPTAAPTPAPAAATDDAGSGPDEAVSDAAAEPHEPTTPDHPVEVVDVVDNVDAEESADKA